MIKSSSTEASPEVDVNNFDVQAYSSSYQGHTKIVRLGFLMDNFPKLKATAAKHLLIELKNGCNVAAYSKVLHSVDETTKNELKCDESIATAMSQNNQAKMEILESELTAAKSAVMKEASRQAYNDIGNLWYQVGNLTEALKSFLRTRDLCTMARHTCEMSLNVISVSIDLKQFFNVVNFVSKVVDYAGDEIVAAKLKIASALSDLYDQQYHQAALKFLEINPCLQNQYNTVISAEDIAIYASVCALATFDRGELRTKLMDNKIFINSYLSLVPEFKAMVLGFCGGEYGLALKLLNSLRPRLLGDMYLSSSVSKLVHLISERMLLQYFAPYSAVDLVRMASSLQMDAKTLETALIRLISSGRLSARIDAQSSTMHRRTREVRHATLDKVRALSQVHAHAVKRDILRLSLMQQNFVVGDGDETGGPQAGSRRGMAISGGGGGGGGGDNTGSGEAAYFAAEEFMQGAGSVFSNTMQASLEMPFGESDGEGDLAEQVHMEDYETSLMHSPGEGTAAVSNAGSQVLPPDLSDMDEL